MRIGLEVLVDLKCLLQEHGALQVKLYKTSILDKGMRQQDACHVPQQMINNNCTLATISGNIALESFSLFIYASIMYICTLSL